MITANRPQVEADRLYNRNSAVSALGVHRNTFAKFEKANLISYETKVGRNAFFLGSSIIKCWYAVMQLPLPKNFSV